MENPQREQLAGRLKIPNFLWTNGLDKNVLPAFKDLYELEASRPSIFGSGVDFLGLLFGSFHFGSTDDRVTDRPSLGLLKNWMGVLLTFNVPKITNR